jgi:hypothetical protein
MVERAPHYRSDDPDVDVFDEDTANYRLALYGLRQSDRNEHPLPVFLSRYADEPDPNEFITPLRKRRRFSISARILAGVCGAAAAAVLYALVSSDAARARFANVETSIAAFFPIPSAAAQFESSRLTERDGQLTDSARPSPPDNQVPGVVKMAAVAPSREDIKAAYQSAVQGSAPAPVAAAAVVIAEPPPSVETIHHLDPDEIAASLKRGDALIASGDVAAARLVLRRPADAGDAQAAMTIAETYDPAFLEKLGVHGVVANVAVARGWYEKAKRFGSAEAAQRLEVLASRQQ